MEKDEKEEHPTHQRSLTIFTKIPKTNSTECHFLLHHTQHVTHISLAFSPASHRGCGFIYSSSSIEQKSPQKWTLLKVMLEM